MQERFVKLELSAENTCFSVKTEPDFPRAIMYSFGSKVLAGEALGAVFSFYIYRKGIKKMTVKPIYTIVRKLQGTTGAELFLLIIALRIFPFIPSGAVTIAGAATTISLPGFALASTIGKIPALLIEAYAVKAVLHWDIKGQLLFAVLSAGLAACVLYKRKR
ncbi:VTT domain-containing protein [Peribacillus deserti]|uniref:VTT domain-containing protein n=1 Tax=Peribacillus deserti TaxID=673318 RepID=A0A2N5MA95_9BACI|nr:VTT domain-containing protein [Peribacillus deserti]PLT31276.1 hypothetical protein CUU66_03635 [Peribacillus deserti]